jgi:hypothetical protein
MIGKVTVSANSTGGDIVLTALPLTFISSGGASTTVTTNNVTLYDELTGANLSPNNNSWGLVPGASSTTTVTLATKNTISAGTSRTYDVYLPVTGTLGTAGTSSVSMQLGAAASFIFTDVNGGLVGIPASDGTTYIVSYPVNQVSVHN